VIESTHNQLKIEWMGKLTLFEKSLKLSTEAGSRVGQPISFEAFGKM
jgi:hypothetical protein